MLQPHIKCKAGDVAKYVLLPGDPGRARKIADYFDDAKEIAYNREFLTINGKYKGIPVTVTSTGIGSPSAAIAVEELANVGVEVFIRIGTCGALRKDIKMGDVIIPFAATRSEGTTKEYMPIEFPAVADIDTFVALRETAKDIDANFFTGINRTHDAFYEHVSNFFKWSDILKDKRFSAEKFPLISSEMECSAVFLTSMLRGLKSAALMVVNTTEALNEIAENPDLIYVLDEPNKTNVGIDKAIQIALGAIERIERENVKK